jgi:hypothetical protein
LGLLSSIRLAFASARFFRSSLIFSIKVLISGAALKLEIIGLPSTDFSEQISPIAGEDNQTKANVQGGADHGHFARTVSRRCGVKRC